MVEVAAAAAAAAAAARAATAAAADDEPTLRHVLDLPDDALSSILCACDLAALGAICAVSKQLKRNARLGEAIECGDAGFVHFLKEVCLQIQPDNRPFASEVRSRE